MATKDQEKPFWLKGDRNAKYYGSIVNCRARQKKITSLQTETSTNNNGQEIKDHEAHCYKTFFEPEEHQDI